MQDNNDWLIYKSPLARWIVLSLISIGLCSLILNIFYLVNTKLIYTSAAVQLPLILFLIGLNVANVYIRKFTKGRATRFYITMSIINFVLMFMQILIRRFLLSENLSKYIILDITTALLASVIYLVLTIIVDKIYIKHINKKLAKYRDQQ